MTARPRRRRRVALLALGLAAPLLAAALIIAAVASNPAVDPATQYVSELGARHATRPWLFNAALLVAGLSAAGLGAGFALAVRALGGSGGWGWAAGVLLLVAGAGLVIGAIYPWPDPRHLAIQAGLGAQIAPLLLALGVRRRPELSRLRIFLWCAFTGLLAQLVVNSGWIFAEVWGRQPFEALVNSSNVGWWERAYMLVLAGWAIIAAVWLERRLALGEPESAVAS